MAARPGRSANLWRVTNDRTYLLTYSSQNSQWPHPSDGSWWGHFTHSSRLICCLWYCRSFHPSHSSSKLVWSWWAFAQLVHILSLISLSGSLNQWFHLCILYSLLWCTPRFRTWPTPFYSMQLTPLGSVFSKNSLKYHLYADDTQLYITFTPINSALSLETLNNTFTDIFSWMNLNKLKLNFFLLGQNNNVSNFLTLQIYLSAMISSQSVPLLAILASSLTLTSLSLIRSTLCPNLVISTSETSVEFVIFFLFLQPQYLQIHLSPANLTTAIHLTLASHKQISTNFNAFKTHWHASSQTLQNINTSHQH